jgi:hypothetical protein
MNWFVEKFGEYYVENPESLERQSKQKMNQILDDLQSNTYFQDFAKIWNEFDDKQKQDIYKDGDYAFSFNGSFQRNLKLLNPIQWPFRNPMVRIFQKDSFKDQFKQDFFEVFSVAIRIFIHLGLLQKPDNLSDQDLIRNIQKDSQNIKAKIWMIEKAAMIIPQLRPALPTIQKIKPIVVSTNRVGTEIMLQRHKQQSIHQIQSDTQTQLFQNISEAA